MADKLEIDTGSGYVDFTDYWLNSSKIEMSGGSDFLKFTGKSKTLALEIQWLDTGTTDTLKGDMEDRDSIINIKINLAFLSSSEIKMYVPVEKFTVFFSVDHKRRVLIIKCVDFVYFLKDLNVSNAYFDGNQKTYAQVEALGYWEQKQVQYVFGTTGINTSLTGEATKAASEYNSGMSITDDWQQTSSYSISPVVSDYDILSLMEDRGNEALAIIDSGLNISITRPTSIASTSGTVSIDIIKYLRADERVTDVLPEEFFTFTQNRLYGAVIGGDSWLMYDIDNEQLTPSSTYDEDGDYYYRIPQPIKNSKYQYGDLFVTVHRKTVRLYRLTKYYPVMISESTINDDEVFYDYPKISRVNTSYDGEGASDVVTTTAMYFGVASKETPDTLSSLRVFGIGVTNMNGESVELNYPYDYDEIKYRVYEMNIYGGAVLTSYGQAYYDDDWYHQNEQGQEAPATPNPYINLNDGDDNIILAKIRSSRWLEILGTSQQRIGYTIYKPTGTIDDNTRLSYFTEFKVNIAGDSLFFKRFAFNVDGKTKMLSLLKDLSKTMGKKIIMEDNVISFDDYEAASVTTNVLTVDIINIFQTDVKASGQLKMDNGDFADILKENLLSYYVDIAEDAVNYKVTIKNKGTYRDNLAFGTQLNLNSINHGFIVEVNISKEYIEITTVKLL